LQLLYLTPAYCACLQAVFLLIGKTSALTMNIAGVIKDWMLIFFSYYIFRAPVTKLNLAGYIFCCRCAALALQLACTCTPMRACCVIL
jgi:hypothetical protein